MAEEYVTVHVGRNERPLTAVGGFRDLGRRLGERHPQRDVGRLQFPQQGASVGRVAIRATVHRQLAGRFGVGRDLSASRCSQSSPAAMSLRSR